ncbi:MAG: 2-oxoglutarate and iron-dependent oxygenase domain-containing protein, partial [Pseudomonadota bacterium]
MSKMTRVPMIDIAPFLSGSEQGKREVADQIDRAAREIGFFLISGHGVDETLVERTYAMVRAFFDMPEVEKLKIRQPAPNISRGYTALGGETLSAGLGEAAPADLKEMIDIGPVDVPGGEYYERREAGNHFHNNLWPASPSGFQQTMESYYRRMNRLANDLMAIFAHALDLPENFF